MSSPENSWSFDAPTALAPMEGVSHPTFRQIVAELGGVGLLCTEFVRISRAPLAASTLRSAVVKAEVDGQERPLSVQVMGNEAAKMAEAARLVAETGADVVDINLGCPMPRVVRKGVGAAMLKDPALLRDVVGAMREAVPGTLSAKIRAGFDDADVVVRNAEILQGVGVDFIAVHPRRRCDFYEGVADWRIIGTLKRELSIPVVGNGDVWYAADVARMQAETGCDAVMIGRPAMRNPWIFEQAADLRAGRTPRDPDGDAVVAYFSMLRERYRPVFGTRSVGKIKEIVRWLGRAINDEGAFRQQALRSKDVDAIVALAEEKLAGLGSEYFDLDATGRFGFEGSGSAVQAS